MSHKTNPANLEGKKNEGSSEKNPEHSVPTTDAEHPYILTVQPGAAKAVILNNLAAQHQQQPSLEVATPQSKKADGPALSPSNNRELSSPQNTANVEKPAPLHTNRDAVQPPISTKGTLSAGDKPVETGSKGLLPQPPEAILASAKTTTQDVGTAKTAVPLPGDVSGRVSQLAGPQTAAIEQAPVKLNPGEARVNELNRSNIDATGVKVPGAQTIEPQGLQVKSAGTNPGDHPQPAGGASPDRKVDTAGVVQNVAPRINETSPVTVQTPKVFVDSPSGNVPSPGGKVAEKPITSEVATALPGSQNKSEPTRIDGANIAPGKFEQIKGDVLSAQGVPLQTSKQDVVKAADTKVETVRPAEQAGVKDSVPVRDPKSVGVLNETLGQKIESGQRAEQTNQYGNKQDVISSAQKADQITKSIESRVNEGAKQPSGADGRVPNASETATSGSKQPGTTDGASTGSRQPGIDGGGRAPGTTDGAQLGVKQTGATDGAGFTGKQPIVSEGASSSVRQPLHEGGEKAPSSGGGGGGTAESIRKVDTGMGAGGKAEAQTAIGGMGGGSSAPTDRAPHKPFSVEDAQPAKGAAGDVRSDVTGARGGEGAGGKVGDVVGGKAGDIAGSKGPSAGGPGPRFDTGEVRGTEPGARFDAGELKDGRSAGTQSGGLKGGDGSAVKGSDAGTVKGTDITGTKGAAGSGQGIGGSSGGSGSGFSGSSEAGILGDKRQPSMLPDGMLNQGGKPGKVGDGISGGGGILGTDVPFVLPGALSGKEGGRRQADQIFTDKGKADVAPVGKQDAVAAAGKFDSSGQGGKSDSSGPAGRGEPVGPGGRGEPGGPGGLSGKGEQQKDFKDKGQKADVGIPAAMAGQIGAGAAEVGGALKNFAQSVLSDGKSAGQAGEGAQISKDLKDAFKAPAAMDGSGKETPNVRQDYSGPGRKTQILPNEITPGTTGVGPGGVPVDAAAKKSELGALGSALPGAGSEVIAAGGFADDAEGGVPLEEFNLPEVDLLSDADEVEEVKEIEEAVEAKIEDEMHYELALGLQLYTSIAGAQYGAYHYHTKDGDTVESVSRDIVGDVRCSPLVFSLNKEHIVASTEYGVHPFKVGVMVQLPTPRDLKEFFGEQA